MKMRGLLSLCGFFALSASAQIDPLSQWAWRNPVPDSYALTGVAYGNGSYVAAGGSAVITSEDATNWIGSISDANAFLYGLRFINGMFVGTGIELVGPGAPNEWTGVGIVMTSATGGHWTNSTTGTDDVLADVTFGNGQWVAVGSGATNGDGSVFTSADGVHWTNTLRLASTPFHAAVFANGLFVIGGYEGTINVQNGVIYVSWDGTHWTNCPSASDSPGWGYSSIVAHNGHLVAVGPGVVANSDDGINWLATYPSNFVDVSFVSYGNNRYVAVSTDRDGRALVSPDGTNWSLQSAGAGFMNQAVGYCSNQFITVGCTVDGTTASLFTSPDGTNWTNPLAAQGSGDSFGLYAATFGTNQSGNGLFIAVGATSPEAGVILTSPDGVAWTTQNTGSANGFFGVASGNNMFVAVGYHGYIAVSTDAANWTETGVMSTNSPTNGAPPIGPYQSGPDLLGVTFGAGQFVAVGDVILTSSTGSNWLSPSSGTTSILLAIAYGGGRFVAVGDNGTIVTSTNGADWGADTSGTVNSLTGIAYGLGMFVATVGGNGSWTDGNQILTSSDGISWTAHTTSPNLMSIAFGGNQFISPGLTGGISTSADGINWTNRVPVPLSPFFGAAYGQGTFVAVGESGEILQSQYLGTPLLKMPKLVQNAKPQIPIAGRAGWSYQVQTSTDLHNWVNLTNVVLRTPSGVFGDSSPTSSHQQRFYRLKQQ